MNARHLNLAVLSISLLCGCHRQARNDTYMELMGAQRRALEDRIYDLEFEMEDMTEELEKVQQENEQLRDQLAGSSEGPMPGIQIEPGQPQVTPRKNDSSRPGVPPIQVDPGTPLKTAPERNPGKEDNEAFELLPAPRDPRPSADNNAKVGPLSHIVIDPTRTAITGFDGRNTNDGVTLALQPRGRDDRYTGVPGTLSIVVLDPAKTGAAARVARWDIQQADVERILATSTETPGIRLELEWPGPAPTNPELMLFVRYELSNGRKFETHARIARRNTDPMPGETGPRDLPGNDSPVPTISLEPDAQTHLPVLNPPTILHIPRETRAAAAPPDTGTIQRLQWRPYR